MHFKLETVLTASLTCVGALFWIFVPYPRIEDTIWMALSGGAIAMLGFARLYYLKWKWSDLGRKMMWTIALGSFVLMLLNAIQFPSFLNAAWNSFSHLLMLTFGGACLYGFFFNFSLAKCVRFLGLRN